MQRLRSAPKRRPILSFVGDVHHHMVHGAVRGWSTICLALVASAATLPAVTTTADVFPVAFDLLTLYEMNGGDGSSGFVVSGNSHTFFGRSRAAAGDSNGDGIDDIVIGAPSQTPNGPFSPAEIARTYIVFGRAQGFPAEWSIGALFAANGGDGSEGVVLNGERDLAGTSVSAGDLNADGLDDVIVGAPDWDARLGVFDPQEPGHAYVVFGSANAFDAQFDLPSLRLANGGTGTAGFVVDGAYERFPTGDGASWMGHNVGGGGDVNGDGLDDFIVGAPLVRKPPFYAETVGESYVIFGRNTGFPAELGAASLLEENGGDGSAGFVLPRDRGASNFVDDMNGDGIHDLIVRGHDISGGFVVFGTESGFPAMVNVEDLLAANGGDGSRGFQFVGSEEFIFHEPAGDINGDGLGDLFVTRFDAGLGVGHGAVLFGSDQGFDPAVDLTSLLSTNGGDGSKGLVLIYAETLFIDGSRARDINDDGIDDLSVQAGGTSFIVFGSDKGFPAEFDLASLLPANGGDGSDGFSIVGDQHHRPDAAGDINHDGIGDLMAYSPTSLVQAETEMSRVYFVYGRSAFAVSNRAPEFTSTPIRGGDEGIAFTFSATASDPDPDDTLILSDVNLPSWLSLTDEGDGTAMLSGTPGAADTGRNLIALKVTDDGVPPKSDWQRFAVTIVPNNAPLFSSMPVTTGRDGETYMYEVMASDADAADTLAVTASNLPAWLTLTDNGNGSATLSGTPLAANVGDHATAITVTDSGAAPKSITQSFTISVLPNNPPVFGSTPSTAATEQLRYTGTITATDADPGDVLTFTADTLPSWLTLTDHGDGTASLSGTPTTDAVGPNAVVIGVADDVAVPKTAVKSFTILVAGRPTGGGGGSAHPILMLALALLCVRQRGCPEI